MAGKVFFSVSMSLDGFIAPESPEELMGQLWMELQQWVFPLRFFRENLKLGEGGEEGRDNDVARETFERTGASVMGKRMFDLGEQAWPEELFGSGIRLFEGVDAGRVALEPVRAETSPRVTHLTYAVRER